MTEILLSPPVAFMIYFFLVLLLLGVGRLLAGPAIETVNKRNVYSSGEAPPTVAAAPGYRPFFVVALFFAVLHLGVLTLGSGDFSSVPGIYLCGLVLTLIVLILG